MLYSVFGELAFRIGEVTSRNLVLYNVLERGFPIVTEGFVKDSLRLPQKLLRVSMEIPQGFPRD